VQVSDSYLLDCTSTDYILFQESYREQISSIKKIDVIANVSDHDITCNLGLFFLIFGFGVIALAALFMRLFRLRKAFSTSLAVSKVRSEDCIPKGHP
jgi:predicted cation transporter